jgi:hypothetical protein
VSDEKKDMSVSPTGALRDNKGKLPVHWFPYEGVEATVAVLYRSSVEGGGKYPRHNWRKGAPLSVPLDSALRHIFKRLGGEKYDDETGLPHLWHALTNLVFAVYYEKHYPQLDDLKDVTPPAGQPEPEQAPPVREMPTQHVGVNGLVSLMGPLLMAMATKSQTPTQEPMGGDTDSKPENWRPAGAAGETD